jgi:hypothetical protein
MPPSYQADRMTASYMNVQEKRRRNVSENRKQKNHAISGAG